MKRNPLIAWLAAAVFAAAGCTMQPTLPQGASSVEAPAQGATLALGFDWGRQVQVLREDVDGATVSIRVNGREPIVRSFGRTDWATQSLDISGLQGGDAMVRVEAYHGAQKVGEGERGVPLVIGRRTFASVYIQLDSRGRTDMMPLVPLGPIPDPNARVIIRALVFRTSGPMSGHHEVILENRTGAPIDDFRPFQLVHQSGNATESMRSGIVMGDGMSLGVLDKDATVSVALDESASGSVKAYFPLGQVQYQAGSLALVRNNMDRPETLVDFVQWGQPGSKYEPMAAEKGLWSSQAFLPLVDPSGYAGFRYFVKTPGERGVTNWDAQKFGPLANSPG